MIDARYNALKAQLEVQHAKGPRLNDESLLALANVNYYIQNLHQNLQKNTKFYFKKEVLRNKTKEKISIACN